MQVIKTNYLHALTMAEDTRVGSECLGFRARLLSRVITAVYDDALAEMGLKVSQFSVLNAVASREGLRLDPGGSIGVAIKSQSRRLARLCYEKAIPLGNKRKAK
jgi:hypothetical protein